MKHRYGAKIAFLCTVMIMTASSCFLADIFSGGSTKVAFSLDPSLMTSQGVARGFDDSTDLEPNEIVWIDVSSPRSELVRQPLVPGQNEVGFSKDGIYMIGLVHVPSATRSAIRSIASAAQTIGNIKISAAGLDSVPLSAGAEDNLNLGALTPETGAYVSNIDPAILALGTGYDMEQLRLIALYDQLGTVKLNVDIDSNGIFDIDEGKRWDFKIFYQFDIPLSEASELFSGSRITWDYEPRITYYLQFWTGFQNLPKDGSGIRLVLPSSAGVMSPEGNPVTYLTDPYAGVFDYLDVEYYFGVNTGTLVPEPPYDGAYVLQAGDTELTFRDMRYFSQANAYEGFFFPVCQLEYDGQDKLSSLKYAWKQLENGLIVDADPFLVEVFSQQTIFGVQLGLDESRSYDQVIFVFDKGDSTWSRRFVRTEGNVEVVRTNVSGDLPGTPGSFNLSGLDIMRSHVLAVRNDIHDAGGNIMAFSNW